jgi:hypothetical protein
MPNPNDLDRAGDMKARSTKLLDSAGPGANTKLSWSEWFGNASNTWLGSATTGYITDGLVGSGRSGTFALAGMALGGTLAGITGFWLVAPAAAVMVDVVGKKLEDMAKEGLPHAILKAREYIGTSFYGGGNPSLVLNRPMGDKALEDTLTNLKNNSALIQDLLNKLAGKAGKAYFCDDVYQIAVLSEKLVFTMGELRRDIELLREFLTQLDDDLKGIDPAAITREVKDLAEEICGTTDKRHWDNSWSSATISRMSRCSREHCYGPK